MHDCKAYEIQLVAVAKFVFAAHAAIYKIDYLTDASVNAYPFFILLLAQAW
jgi:hypothetical protein